MVTRYVLPLLAVLGLGFAVFTVVQARGSGQPSAPRMSPPKTPEFRSIAGAGLIEARMENVPVGTPTAGVVTNVFVPIFELPVKVKVGDPLFQLDDRTARAEVSVRESMLAAAEAEVHKLDNAPRKEDVPPAQAALDEAVSALAEADARLRDAETNNDRITRLRAQNAVTSSEYDTSRFALAAARAASSKAKATEARARADLDKLVKGTWEEDKLVARAKRDEARAQLEAAKIELDRLTVRALTDGEVLQVNVRPGQFAALAWKEPLVVIGDVKRLHVRVDIDEQDLPHFQPGAKAIATLKGRPMVRFDLQFVKVEPYVIPKRSLTGENSERVDTRVLQVIYALPDDRPVPLYVGQQMDAYIAKAEPPKSVQLDAGPDAPKPFDDAPKSTPEKSADRHAAR